MSAKPKTSTPGARIYAVLLRCYPSAYRREYGPLMLQLFCDQYRDAVRDTGRRGVCRLWLRVLADVPGSSLQQHWYELKGIMKPIGNPKSLSWLLFLAGLGVAALSLAFGRLPLLMTAAIHLSSLLLIAKAAADWLRPHADWWKALLQGLFLAVAYGVLMPAWAKITQETTAAHLVPLPTALIPMLANLAVPLCKGLALVIQHLRLKQP